MATRATDWEATRYLRFENERTRPARDLLAQIPLSSPSKIVDLGCGPGNSTSLLAQRFPQAQLIGMDSSPNMIDKARQALLTVSFELGDLRSYTPPANTDVIYSNAVFQWLAPEERIPTIRRFLSFLSSGGVFAMQVPDNFHEPSHRCMRETAASSKFQEFFEDDDAGNKVFSSPFELYNALQSVCADINIWHTIYEHRLDGHEAIVDWFRSTGLRPFLERLDDQRQKEFLEEYLGRIKREYEVLIDGGVLLKFPRLFLVLTK